MKRVCLIASASGNGKTTVGRALASELTRFPVLRLRTTEEVEDFLRSAERAT